jgi:hypothetical protein
MNELWSLIFGVIAILLGFCIALFALRKSETRRIESKRKRWILVVFGALISMTGLYIIIGGDDVQYQSVGKRPMPADWTPDMRNSLIEECMEGAAETAAEYPDIVREYCECSADTVMHAMTYEDYRRYSKLSDEEQEKIFRPLSEDCQMLARLKRMEQDK